MEDLAELKQRIRREIWTRLETSGVSDFPRPIFGRIPNFLGRERAAELLCSLPAYRTADVVFVSPDSPQLPVREAVLRDGKRLIMASPRLRKGFLELADPGVGATISAAMRFGREIKPWEITVDLMVEGSVAVDAFGGRLGKGGGFGDLEFAILVESGAVTDATPVATTVHELQLVEKVPMTQHDVPVDIVVTQKRVLKVERKYPRPAGVLWDLLDESAAKRIPLLAELGKRVGHL